MGLLPDLSDIRLREIMKKSVFKFGLMSLLTIFVPTVNATPDFLDKWRTEYPGSTSGDIRCQLCHVLREGGSPWNAYGRDVRNRYNNLDPGARSIEQALRMVESLNSDADTPMVDNQNEISNNSQPGWRQGQVNLAYDRDDFIVGVFHEPVTVNPFPTALNTKNYPLEMVEVVGGLTSPVGAVAGPTHILRKQMFVWDQIGIVWRVNLTNGTKSPYIDVRDRLVPLGVFSPGGYDERGLLGFAFHPDFEHNGRVYLHTSEPVSGPADFSTLTGSQVANHQSVISELVIANQFATTEAAQISTQRELLRIDQPQYNHNGGALIFNSENQLFIALGDGGGADDQGIGHGENGNGSDPSNALGSILRIDPLGRNSANGEYGIPSTNPFFNDATNTSEIFAYGFRNPWKLSIDRNGDLYAADVGQNDIEEVNRVELGQHYGWRVKEGRFFFDPNDNFSGIITVEIPDILPPVALIDPVLQYDHDEGISVTGGYVYRGNRNPGLVGKYIFGDFQKRLFVGDLGTGQIDAMSLVPSIFVYSLAQDNEGALYFMGNSAADTTGASGKLIKLQSTLPEASELCFPLKTKNGDVSLICL